MRRVSPLSSCNCALTGVARKIPPRDVREMLHCIRVGDNFHLHIMSRAKRCTGGSFAQLDSFVGRRRSDVEWRVKSRKTTSAVIVLLECTRAADVT